MERYTLNSPPRGGNRLPHSWHAGITTPAPATAGGMAAKQQAW